MGWILTAVWGIPQLDAELTSTFLNHHELATRLEFDPDFDTHGKPPLPPWYFIGNTTVPAPFLIAIDCAYVVGPNAGDRSRYYMLWFFGFYWSIYQDGQWMA